MNVLTKTLAGVGVLTVAAGIALTGGQVAGHGSPDASVAAAAPAADTTLDSYVVPAAKVAPLDVSAGNQTILVGQGPLGFTATAASCQTSKMLASGRYLHVDAVDWAHGVLKLRKTLPLCAGVVFRGAGAAFAFEVGAKKAGHGRPSDPLWPQTRVAVTAWHNLGSATVVTVNFPPVRNQCTQTDVAIWTQGTSGNWPARLLKPGVPQPRGVAYYVGNNKGCYNAPGLAVTAKCPVDCTGVATVTYTATNPNPYAAARVRIIVGGHVHSWVQVAPRARKAASIRIADGTRYSFQYQLGFGKWTAPHAIGPVRTVLCPPAPHLSFTLDCPCGGTVTATVSDRNDTRYAHKITVGAKSITVPAHKSGTLKGLSWAKGRTVVVTSQSFLGSKAVGAAVKVPLTVG